MSFPALTELLLSAHRAALDHVDGRLVLLSVDPEPDRQRIVVRGIYSNVPDEKQLDLVECIASEILSDMDSEGNVVTRITNRSSEDLLSENEMVVFVSRECRSQFPLERVHGIRRLDAEGADNPSAYREILLSGYRATVGRIDASLECLTIAIDLAKQRVTLEAIYKQRLGRFQSDLIDEISDDMVASLGCRVSVEAHVRYGEEARTDNRFLFSRYGG